MKIIVTCLVTNSYLPKWIDCIDSQKRYCNKFGFEYDLVQECPHNNPWWYKIEHVRELLDRDYDCVILLDSDIFIRDTSPSILEIISVNDKFIFVANGISNRINSGVIILKNHEKVRTFFDQLISDKNNKIDSKDPDFVTSFGENGHIIKHCKNSSIVQIIDSKWNNNRSIQTDDCFRHYCSNRVKPLYKTERNDRFNQSHDNSIVLNSINRINDIVRKYNIPIQGNVWTKHLDVNTPHKYLMQKVNTLRICSSVSKSMLEIGFNAGHSAIIAMEFNPDLRLLSCDICVNEYTEECVSFVKSNYKNFSFIKGDSKDILKNDIGIFDTIFIDGSHDENDLISDIKNTRTHAHSNTCLIIDDLNLQSVKNAVDKMQRENIIKSTGNITSMFIGYYVGK
jgi:precorrin-6B methylase 2